MVSGPPRSSSRSATTDASHAAATHGGAASCVALAVHGFVSQHKRAHDRWPGRLGVLACVVHELVVDEAHDVAGRMGCSPAPQRP